MHAYIFFLLLGLQLASFPPIVLLTQVFTPSEISLLFSYFSLACSSVSLFVLLHIFAFTRHCSIYFKIWRGHQDGCWSCLYTVRYCFYCRLHFGYRFVRLFVCLQFILCRNLHETRVIRGTKDSRLCFVPCWVAAFSTLAKEPNQGEGLLATGFLSGK